jgi:SAM-dependent methyltransferase
VRLAQSDREDWAAVAGSDWRDAESLYLHVTKNTNLVEAAHRVPWDDVLPEHAAVLDLGCGSGWLTALLTRHPRVEKIVAWDASPALLKSVLPATVSLAGGDLSKVERVCGHFTPLLLDDDSIDLVVMSSAFHHCSTPVALLDDLSRVIRGRGGIVLLNEVPLAIPHMLASIATRALAAIVNSSTTKVTVIAPGHVAADHVLYDDVLGDRALTRAQYLRLFRSRDFDVQVLETSFPSYRRHYRSPGLLERNLTHFLLRRRAKS